MRGRLLIGFLILVVIVAGYPYAGFVLNRILGTAPVVLVEHDGRQRTLIIGPGAPRPDWFPIMPAALLVSAAHWVPGPTQTRAGHVELLSHASVSAIKAYYLERLRAAGFDMRDVGVAPMTPALARWLGIAGMLQGWRRDTGVAITVQIGTPSGLVFPSRTIQLQWRIADDGAGGTGGLAGPVGGGG